MKAIVIPALLFVYLVVMMVLGWPSYCSGLTSPMLYFGGSAMALIASATSCDKHVKYPAAPSDNTVDEYFGTAVADPYRPLENDTSATTLQWVEAENAVTHEYLSKIPFREALRKRIASFNNYVKQGLPWKAPDKRYYFYKNDVQIHSRQSLRYSSIPTLSQTTVQWPSPE